MISLITLVKAIERIANVLLTDKKLSLSCSYNRRNDDFKNLFCNDFYATLLTQPKLLNIINFEKKVRHERLQCRK